MPEITTTEGLMIFIIDLLAQEFPNSAIIKGGMGLRLLDCPRTTNDIDYIFVPYSSKKDIVESVLTTLRKVEGLTVKYSLNSKCLRIKIQYGDFATQVEANVALECPSVAISTAAVARKNGLLARVVRVVRHDVAMANKLAAWNERQLVRDLYDLHFYYAIGGFKPDMVVLCQRLNKVASTPRNRNPKQMTIAQLVEKLRKRLLDLGSADIRELADYLSPEEMPGLEIRLRVQLLKLCDELEARARERNDHKEAHGQEGSV
jgi:hypothetical protein